MAGAGAPMPEISAHTRLSEATLSRILRGHRPGPPPVPAMRCERTHPGEWIHLDTKKLGRIERVGHRITGNPRDHVRGAGRECVHVCIDDHSRVSHAEIRPDEKRESAGAFLEAALASCAALGVTVQRVTAVATSRRPSARPATASHLRTKPYTPKTKGKAERFIQSALRGWPYAHSDERSAALANWLHRSGIGPTDPCTVCHPSADSTWGTTS